MRYLLIFIFTLSVIPNVYAQDEDMNRETFKEWTRGARVVPVKYSSDVEGTPYYNDKWQTGIVLLGPKNESDPVKLRFNVHKNQLLFQRDGEVLSVDPNNVIGFALLENNQQIFFKNGFNSSGDDISPSLFLRMIFDGKTKLVAKHNKKFHEPRSSNPLTGERVSKFIPKTDYYLITSDNDFHDIKLKEKDVLQALGNHQKELKKYAKTNDLDFGKESDLPQILAYYDDLKISQ